MPSLPEFILKYQISFNCAVLEYERNDNYHIVGQWSSSGHVYFILPISVLWVNGAIYKPESCTDAEAQFWQTSVLLVHMLR